MAQTFNTANFDNEVLQSTEPVLVDFYADWCVPCKMMAPVVEQLAEDYAGKVKIGKLNVDESGEIAGRFRVMSIPTFILFKDGKPAGTIMGAVPPETLQEMIDGSVA